MDVVGHPLNGRIAVLQHVCYGTLRFSQIPVADISRSASQPTPSRCRGGDAFHPSINQKLDTMNAPAGSCDSPHSTRLRPGD